MISGKEILLSELTADNEALNEMLENALETQFGCGIQGKTQRNRRLFE